VGGQPCQVSARAVRERPEGRTENWVCCGWGGHRAYSLLTWAKHSHAPDKEFRVGLNAGNCLHREHTVSQYHFGTVSTVSTTGAASAPSGTTPRNSSAFEALGGAPLAHSAHANVHAVARRGRGGGGTWSARKLCALAEACGEGFVVRGLSGEGSSCAIPWSASSPA